MKAYCYKMPEDKERYLAEQGVNMAGQTQTEKLRAEIQYQIALHTSDTCPHCEGLINQEIFEPLAKSFLQACKEAGLVFAEVGVKGNNLEGACICKVEEIEI